MGRLLHPRQHGPRGREQHQPLQPLHRQSQQDYQSQEHTRLQEHSRVRLITCRLPRGNRPDLQRTHFYDYKTSGGGVQAAEEQDGVGREEVRMGLSREKTMKLKEKLIEDLQ